MINPELQLFMAKRMGAKTKASGFKKVSRPKPQTVETPGDVSLHKVRPSPRFTFNTGDRITDELAVIGHLWPESLIYRARMVKAA